MLCKKCTLCYAYGMSMDASAVRVYFAKLGLEQEIADIYMALYAHGPQHIAALSRLSGVERTRIYRLIDTLLESNLIEVDSSHTRGIIKAAPISNLRILINRRNEELKNLTDELELLEQVMARNSLSYGHTRVQFFPGIEGIRQTILRTLQAKTEITGYTNADLFALLGDKFANNLSSDQKKCFISMKNLPDRGQNHSCYVYNDIVAYLYTQDEPYGLEIYDPQMANALKNS